MPVAKKLRLPRVLDPNKIHAYPYSPRLGSEETRRAVDKARFKGVHKMLKRVPLKSLSNGDRVYVKLNHYSAGENGPNSSWSTYPSKYYLHEIVERDGKLHLRSLTKTPAAPAASRVYLRKGTTVPLSNREQGIYYKLKNKNRALVEDK
jgi:hypothetical protein